MFFLFGRFFFVVADMSRIKTFTEVFQKGGLYSSQWVWMDENVIHRNDNGGEAQEENAEITKDSANGRDSIHVTNLSGILGYDEKEIDSRCKTSNIHLRGLRFKYIRPLAQRSMRGGCSIIVKRHVS